jgi:hypothetical protein
MRLLKLSIIGSMLYFSAITAGETSLLKETWNNRIKIVTTEQGEKLAVAAICADADRIYLYHRGERTLLCYDTAGRHIRTIALESIGRNTYVGDDFVVRDSLVLFVNSIDRRLEQFDLTTGRHLSSRSLPEEPFKSAPKRSQRIIDRIFFDSKTVLVGNSHLLVDYDPHNPGQSRLARAHRAPAQGRYELVTRNGSVVSRPDGTVAWQGRITRPLKSAIECTGKAYIVLKSRLYTIAQDDVGLRIVELK